MDGWDFGPGNFADQGVDYGWESQMFQPSATVSNADSGGFLSGIGQLLGYAGKTYVDVKAADAKAATARQYSPWGGYYQEGQPGVYRQPNGSLPILPLLIIGGLFFALKD